MNITLITEPTPMPKKQTRFGHGPEGAALRKQAIIALWRCKQDNHVRFEGIDRSRILGWLQNEVFMNRKYKVIRIAEDTYGAWRIL